MTGTRVLVTGATGTVGRRLVPLLVGRGAAVSAAGRTGRAPAGATGVRFDWHDPATHDAALDGTEAVHLVPPVPGPDPEAVMVPFLDRAVAAGVRRAVLLGNIVTGAGGSGIGAVHAALAERFDEWAVLRPNWFMQDFTGEHPLARGIRVRHALAGDVAGQRVGFIDALDVARTAVEALLRPVPLNDDPVLTGPAALGYDDVVAVLGRTAGRPIAHQRVERSRLAAFYEEAGVPPASAAFVAVMDQVIASGTAGVVTDAVQRITGSAPRDLATFAAAEFRL